MAVFSFTPIDNAIARSIVMIIRRSPPPAGEFAPIDQFLGTNFPFQLPPKVSGDNKSADWEEEGKIGYEPLAFWMGAKARSLKIDAQYIITGSSRGGLTWNGDTIAKLASTAKSYFYRSLTSAFDGPPPAGKGDNTGYKADDEEGQTPAPKSTETDRAMGPVVEIQSLYGAVRAASTWRMTSVGVEYSENIIKDKDGYFPLWTKISFDLTSYTAIVDNLDEKYDKKKLQDGNLSPAPTWEWY